MERKTMTTFQIVIFLVILLFTFSTPCVGGNYESLKYNCKNELQNENYDTALSFCKKALTIQPGDSDLYAHLAGCHLGLEQNETALEWTNKGIEVNPASPQLLHIRALILKAAGQIDSAINDDLKALALDPGYRPAYTNLGRIFLYQKKDYEKAVEYFNGALAIAGEDAYLNYYLGNAHEMDGNPESALQFYNDVLAYDPADTILLNLTYNGIGNIYFYDFLDYAKAIENYEKAAELNPRKVIYANISNAYNHIGQYDKAIAWSNKGLKTNSKNPDLCFSRGQAHLEKGETAKAIIDFKMTVLLNPAAPHAYKYLAEIYDDGTQDNRHLAIEYYKKAHDRYENDAQRAFVQQKIMKLGKLRVKPDPLQIARQNGFPEDKNKLQEIYRDFLEAVQVTLTKDSQDLYKQFKALQTDIKDLELQDFETSNPTSKDLADFFVYQKGNLEKATLTFENKQKLIKSGPQLIAKQYNKAPRPDNFEEIQRLIAYLPDFKINVLLPFKEGNLEIQHFGVSTRAQEHKVFRDLPLDLSNYEQRYLLIKARIDREYKGAYIISELNENGREAVADIPRKLIRKSGVSFGEDCYLICRLVSFVKFETLIGTPYPVAKVKVEGLIRAVNFKRAEKYIMGNPEDFPPEKYLSIQIS
jgi:tetratricopeptide (TPR) repeat protein